MNKSPPFRRTLFKEKPEVEKFPFTFNQHRLNIKIKVEIFLYNKSVTRRDSGT